MRTKSKVISRKKAERLLHSHDYHSQDTFDAFYSDLGKQEHYNLVTVLNWLGYK